ncbi:MAG: hypothetical protein ABIL68_12930, partial [bacterium]
SFIVSTIRLSSISFNTKPNLKLFFDSTSMFTPHILMAKPLLFGKGWPFENDHPCTILSIDICIHFES